MCSLYKYINNIVIFKYIFRSIIDLGLKNYDENVLLIRDTFLLLKKINVNLQRVYWKQKTLLY